jgi:hypothetical protein
VAKTVEEAFVELRRCVGTQFDEASLVALEKAVGRHGWEPVGREELDQAPIELKQPPTKMEKGPTDGTQVASI